MSRFRALMWLIAIALALVILIGTARGSHSGHATGAREHESPRRGRHARVPANRTLARHRANR